MIQGFVPKLRLIGVSYCEMPQDGRRYRFRVAKYLHDDGTEYGEVLGMEEIPDVGPYFWVPSWGAENQDEAEYLRDEYEERDRPQQEDFWGAHREAAKQQMAQYNDLRDARADYIKRNPRTLGGAR